MKTTNYKNVVVVAMNNSALIANSQGGYTTAMNCTNNTVASLQVMKLFLSKIPTNAEELLEEPRLLVLGEKSAIKGFATGTNLQYIRTGENASGKKFTDEEFELIKEVSFLLADRCLNVRVTTDKYVSYNDKEARALIDGAWTKLKEAIKGNNASAVKPQAPQAQQAPAKSPVIAKLEELMAKALDEGDFDQYDKLEERLNKMLAKETAQPVQPAPQVTNEVEVPEELTEEEELETLDI
jgi:hypothetical protein